MLLALTVATAILPTTALAQPADPRMHLSWPEALQGEQPLVTLGLEGTGVPEVVDFHDRQGLRFSHDEATVARVLDSGSLRVTGPLSVAVVVEFTSPVPAKSAFVSKWLTQSGFRSWELGILPRQRVFWDVSASGEWPREARELITSRSLAADTPYLVVAAFDPGRRMAIYVNGHLLGETTSRVPASIFAGETPVYLGNRYRSVQGCGLDGALGKVWVFDRALSEEEVAAFASAVGLTDEPARALAVSFPFDLDAFRERAREWYEGLQAPGAQYGAYRLSPSREPDMYASADMAWSRYMMDDLGITEEQRAEWIDFLQDQQNADGTYRHLTGHCATHAFCHATGALGILGGKHRHKATLLHKYLPVEGVDEWLDGIDWYRQWGASHDIWGAGVPLVCSPRTPQEWRDAVFEWLDREADPETGFWRKGEPASRPMEYLGGAFHIWPLYAAVNRPIPYPERVVDSVLALQRDDGFIGAGPDYGNMDGVWVLAYLLERIDYRRDDIRAALRRNAEAMVEAYTLAPGSFLSDAHGTESRISTLAILQNAMPELFTSSVQWRNPWHERRLFEVWY